MTNSNEINRNGFHFARIWAKIWREKKGKLETVDVFNWSLIKLMSANFWRNEFSEESATRA